MLITVKNTIVVNKVIIKYYPRIIKFILAESWNIRVVLLKPTKLLFLPFLLY